MKNVLLTTLFTLSAYIITAQNVLVADNNPGAPSGAHVYSTLQAAVNAASAGDIIHVIPSATVYDNGSTIVTIAKDSISIYGIGFNPDKDGPQITNVYRLYVNGSNIRIAGLNVTDYINIGQSGLAHNGITIENSDVGYITTGGGQLSNILVRGCILNRSNDQTNYAINFSLSVNNSVITNCIIEHYNSGTNYETVTAYNGTIIKNCIFYGNDNAAFENLSNCTISNCIFYGAYPTSAGTFSNNVFNNNAGVNIAGVNHTWPPAGQTGSGNVTVAGDTTVFADPAVTINTANWSLQWDPTVASDSLKNAGTDGTDIGVMGGTIPYSVTGTPLPLIQKLIIPEVIRQGDDINATIKATGN